VISITSLTDSHRGRQFITVIVSLRSHRSHSSQPHCTTKMVDQVITIQVLPDDTLLLIFFFHRRLSESYPYDPDPSFPVALSREWEWYVLAHVCQRWRYLIFASPRHLGLRLFISDRTWYGSPFRCWPPFPISIWFNFHDLSPKHEDRIIEALKHPDRIHEIVVNVSNSMMLEKSTAWVEHSFPALECLFLKSLHDAMVLPQWISGRIQCCAPQVTPPRTDQHFLSYIASVPPVQPQSRLS
jgi:hypothetical protein